MEREFKPKKTITIQMSPELHAKMEKLLLALGTTKTCLLEKLITEAYDDLFSEQRV